jgi:hypothetical protein
MEKEAGERATIAGDMPMSTSSVNAASTHTMLLLAIADNTCSTHVGDWGGYGLGVRGRGVEVRGFGVRGSGLVVGYTEAICAMEACPVLARWRTANDMRCKRAASSLGARAKALRSKQRAWVDMLSSDTCVGCRV